LTQADWRYGRLIGALTLGREQALGVDEIEDPLHRSVVAHELFLLIARLAGFIGAICCGVLAYTLNPGAARHHLLAKKQQGANQHGTLKQG
jgi:hypothetical protein